ncbi:MAG TPA: thioredoxin domain-containing protein [Pyrinomonadaceae bacterium]|nr:thioredoxin domain-containing protein [Pyrinomonadaceae bacterium]
MKRALPFLIIGTVLVIAVVAALYLRRSANTPVAPPAPASPAASNGTTTGNDTAATETGAIPLHTQGPENAPVTLEEFGDFECPPCGMLHPVLRTMEKEFGPRLRLVFREFPLVPTHVHALAAARSAEAAGLQGKFWEMHDLLYENQKTWHDAFDARPIFEDYATRIGLNLEKFRSDSAGETVAQRIFLDGKRAHALGVSGTPTVYMNGREVPFESLAPDKLRALINAQLNAK